MKGNFEKLVNSNVPVLIDFYAEWCGPCKMMPPILKEVKETLGDRIKIVKIDVDKNPHIAQRFQIRGVPTLMLFKNGEALWRQSGVVPANQILAVMEKEGISG